MTQKSPSFLEKHKFCFQKETMTPRLRKLIKRNQKLMEKEYHQHGSV